MPATALAIKSIKKVARNLGVIRFSQYIAECVLSKINIPTNVDVVTKHEFKILKKICYELICQSPPAV